MRKEVLIFHFLPLEIFPPVLNFTSYCADNGLGKFPITVITTYPDDKLQLYKNKNITIIRCKSIDASSSNIVKAFRYFKIYSIALYYLLRLRPKVILYFETLSSLPPLIYKWVFKKSKLYIHYHEIVTLAELSSGRTLNKFLNNLEKKFYDKASWISQTNQERVNIFLRQYNIDFEESKHKVLPNYPSKLWFNFNESDTSLEAALEEGKDVIKLLHIGALSFDGMYLKELIEEFGNKKAYEIHFYSHTKDVDIINKLRSYKNIKFNGSINYNDIPTLRRKFDVGLVLYKGKSLNFKYNAPNKIFEYLALDLDVWCSNKLVTAKDYVISDTYPKMLMVDFENLSSMDVKKALSKEGIEYQKSPYFSEMVYRPLFQKIHDDISV